MQFKVGGMDQIDNDPSSSRNNIVSPEEAEVEEVGGLLPDVVLVAEGSIEEVEDEGEEVDVVPEELEEDEFGNHEISVLSRQLDQLQSVLDEIESRNDNIHKELLEILYSNREVRKTMSAENQTANNTEPTVVPSSSDGSESSPSINSAVDVEQSTNELSNDTMELLKLVKTVTEEIDKL